MRKLFNVPAGRKVRITSKSIRWAESKDDVQLLAENIVWTGTTTNHWWSYQGVRRRLITDHSLEFKQESGVWQSDCDCFVIG